MYRIGHRGAGGHAVENTAAAIRKALEMHLNMIELDVRQCATGELVICHDRSINRITNGIGLISKLALSKIKSHQTIDGQKILTLDEALEIVDGRCLINLHLKTADATDLILSTIEKAIKSKKWSVRHFILASFNIKQLIKIKKINPKIRIGLLCLRNTVNVARRAKKLNLYSLHIYRRLMKKRGLETWRKRGIKIFAWTVNNERGINRAKKLKIDGIISDFPDRI